MNVLNRVTWNNLKKNKTRTIVTIIGVILSAAMITAVTTFVSTMQDYMLRSVIAQDGEWHVRFNGLSPPGSLRHRGGGEGQNLFLSLRPGLCRAGEFPKPG